MHDVHILDYYHCKELLVMGNYSVDLFLSKKYKHKLVFFKNVYLRRKLCNEYFYLDDTSMTSKHKIHPA